MSGKTKNQQAAGDYVYEPFSGSGTTIIAGEIEGRYILAMEVAANYCDLAVKRWQEYTGKDATLAATGATFSDVSERRLSNGKHDTTQSREAAADGS